MMKKGGICLLIILAFVVISLNFISAQVSINNTPQVNYCCEKTTKGVYCQNAPKDQCDANFKATPTSCEATSYCKKGCCYDSSEGICMDNTPQEACKSANGAWTGKSCSSAAQCGLGCCVMGQQAAYTTLIRCKKLAAFYGIESDFRSGITNELDCIQLAGAQDVGACVFESEFQKTCKFETRTECETAKKNSKNSSIGFHKDYLCTAPELETTCQPTSKTTCVEGRDGAYFLDSCGNIANIYDSSKVYDNNKGDKKVLEYWTKIKTREESCGVRSGNINSKTCGNCDYLLGSRCSQSTSKNRPGYGDYVCRDLNCYKTSNGKDYKNGESWCFYDNNDPKSATVGSRYYRHICMMGEEMVEPCADYRQETCYQSSISYSGGSFAQAGCVINRWQECALINKSDDCLNSDKRDCKWISLEGDVKNATTNTLTTRYYGTAKEKGKCVPDVATGLMFWDSSSKSTCSLGSQSCVVKYEKKLLGDKKCVANCSCLEESAKTIANNICTAYGDCGAKYNYAGKYVDKGYKITIKKDGTQSTDSGQGGAAAAGTTTTSTAPASASSTVFEGNGNATVFSGSPAASGSVIQGLIVKSYNRVRGAE
ncbi:MAG: hypothetical protein WC796_00470 [Candidatus Pacearchaeota archaeon]